MVSASASSIWTSRYLTRSRKHSSPAGVMTFRVSLPTVLGGFKHHLIESTFCKRPPFSCAILRVYSNWTENTEVAKLAIFGPSPCSHLKAQSMGDRKSVV